MQWTDEAIVLGTRRHGESALILEVMTLGHGRHLGLAHGGRSKAMQPVLQPGNTVQATWRARLDEHLGTFTVEAGTLRAARFIAAPTALYGLGALAALLRVLPERDPHPALYESLTVLVEHLDDRDIAPALFVRFEIALLSELGFGLDLSRCAATGNREDLAYVSPRSGGAVSAAAGAPYRERLLRLPAFLAGRDSDPKPADVAAGFALTEFFLRRHVFEPRGEDLPEERRRFAAAAVAADLPARF
jgi:DNA repair protein RecO (recombination protein O)